MGPRFESVKAHQWPVGQVVKTAASHAVNIGSNPVRVTNFFMREWKLALDKLSRNEYNSLLLKRTVRKRKLMEVSFAYFSFQRKVSRC